MLVLNPQSQPIEGASRKNLNQNSIVEQQRREDLRQANCKPEEINLSATAVSFYGKPIVEVRRARLRSRDPREARRAPGNGQAV